MVVLFPIEFWLGLSEKGFIDVLDFFDYLFWAIALMGVFGYCYSKVILKNKFWQMFLPFIIIWDVFIAYYEISSDPRFHESLALTFFIIFYLVFLLPQYIGIYLYGRVEHEKDD